MTTRRRKILLVGMTALLFAAGPNGLARANFFDESCQTIRLSGKIETPAGFPEDQPLTLTLTYQLNFQNHPTYLKVNLPLGARDFVLNIVGYRKRTPQDLYIPIMFYYPREVKFQYYVKSPRGNWLSTTHTTTYLPALTRVDEAGDCQPDLNLETLEVKKK